MSTCGDGSGILLRVGSIEVVKTDVLIVGGGPAGLAAAIAARQRGFTVTVVDAAKPPIDKACGEGLMPDGVEALARLGVRIAPCDFAPFWGIRFINGGTVARADFPGVFGMGVRRTRLHPLLVNRAEEVGVRLLWNTAVRELDFPSARWIVGADGMNSAVRRWAGFGGCPARLRRFGFRRHFPVAPWTDTVDVHWGRDCQVYVTPVGANEVCVAVISRHRHLRLGDALIEFPELAARLGPYAPVTPERGSVTECRRLPRVYRGNVALIGDASGSVDAITGEGLALSFRQALALAEAFAADDLRLYDAAHRRIARMPGAMANLMLLIDERGWLRHPVIRLLAAQPRLFSALLRMHIGAASQHETGLACFQFSKTQ